MVGCNPQATRDLGDCDLNHKEVLTGQFLLKPFVALCFNYQLPEILCPCGLHQNKKCPEYKKNKKELFCTIS